MLVSDFELRISDFARGQSVWRNDIVNTGVIFARGQRRVYGKTDSGSGSGCLPAFVCGCDGDIQFEQEVSTWRKIRFNLELKADSFFFLPRFLSYLPIL